MRLARAFALAATLAATSGGAEPLEVLKDLNRTVGAIGSSAGAIAFGSGHLTSLCTDKSGCDLWQIDTATRSASRVKHLPTTPWGGFTAVGSYVYFTAGNTNPGTLQVWRTDGTEVGTTVVADTNLAYLTSTAPRSRAAVGSSFYFVYSTAVGDDLFRVDAAGDFSVVKTAVRSNVLVVHGAWAYFVSGSEIWRVNEAGALEQVSTAFNVSSGPAKLGDKLLYRTNAGGLESRLMAFEGTPGATPDIVQSTTNGSTSGLALLNDKAYFLRQLNGAGPLTTTLWQTDGTAAGTVSLQSWPAGLSGGLTLTAAGSYLYFIRTDHPTVPNTLWRSDGTAAPVVPILRPDGTPFRTLLGFSVAGDTGLWFMVQDADGNSHPWFTGGTPETTAQLLPAGGVGTISPFAALGAFGALTNLNVPGEGPVYLSDGTAAGTLPLLVAPGQPSNSSFCAAGGAVAGSVAYFAARDESRRCTIWKTDGTAAGTAKLGGSIYPLIAAGATQDPTMVSIGVNGRGVFSGFDESSAELWASDGTVAGTTRIKDIIPGATSSAPRDFARMGGFAYFFADVGGSQTGLWRTDGTTDGTTLVVSLARVPLTFDNPRSLFATGDALYFLASTSASGYTLWRSDGTAAGTVALKVVGANAAGFTAAGNRLYFMASDAGGTELWRSDGTADSTVRVTDLNPGAANGVSRILGTRGASVVFNGRSGGGTDSLWISDGTAAGTLLLGVTPADSQRGVAAGPHLYFAVGSALQRTDDTGTGVAMVKIHAGPVTGPLLAQGNAVFYIADEALWFSEGTAGDTVQVASLAGLISPTSLPTVLPLPDHLVLSMGSTIAGYEPIVFPHDKTPDPISFATKNARVGAVAVSDPFRVRGITTYVPVSATNGQFCVSSAQGCSCDVAPYSASGVVGPSQFLCVRHTASSVPLTDTTTTITVGTTTATFTSSTRALVAFAVSSAALAEAGSVSVQVTRVGAAGAVSVNWGTVDGSAQAGVSFGTPGSPAAVVGTLNWDDGDETPRTLVIGGPGANVPLIDNAAYEPAGRAFTLALANPSANADLGDIAAVQVQIEDDDSPVEFVSTSLTVTEGTSPLVLSVRKPGTSALPVTVTWSAVPGTATEGVDYGGPSSGTLTWAPGDVAPKTISLPILNDAIPEPVKAFSLQLSAPTNARLGAASVANVALVDNDAGFVFTAPTFSANEAQPSATLTVTRIGATPRGSTTVKWSAANGTAAAGQDYGTKGNATPPSGTLSFGVAETTKSITIPILADIASEGPETFTVTLSTPSTGMAIGVPATATVTIVDDDIPAESRIAFSQPKYAVLENAGNAVLILTRTPIGAGFTASATVSYATVPGTALATSDFTTRSGTVTWTGADASDKTISIPLANNAVAEPHEAFKVTLAPATAGVEVATPEVTVTILDDDEPFPPFAAIPAGWTVPAAASAGWHVSNDAGAYDGFFSLRSDAIGDNETAQLEVTRNFAAGNVIFYPKVSTEAGFDVLRFYVDGVEKAAWSGTTVAGWQLYNQPITAGVHTLRWSYEKDGSASVGADAAWIDGVRLP